MNIIERQGRLLLAKIARGDYMITYKSKKSKNAYPCILVYGSEMSNLREAKKVFKQFCELNIPDKKLDEMDGKILGFEYQRQN